MKILQLLWRHARRETLSAVVLSALGGLFAGAVMLALQRVFAAGRPTLGHAAIVAALALLQIATSIGARRAVLHALHRKLTPFTRREPMRAASESPLRRLEALGTAPFRNAVETSAIEVGFGAFSLVQATRSAASALGAMLVFALLAPGLTPVAVAFLVVAVGVVVFLLRHSAQKFVEAQSLAIELQRDIDNLVSGNRELRQNASRREAFFEGAFEPHVRRLHASVARGSIFSGFAAYGVTLAFMALLGAIIFTDLRAEVSALTGRACILALLYAQAEVVAAVALSEPVRRAGVAIASIDRVIAALATREARSILPSDAPPPACSTLALVGITATYQTEEGGRNFALGPVDLELRSGQITFVIGGNGSGKSTLAKVLCGLYPPASGEIRLDGKVIDDGNREAYRQHFSAIFSDYHVFKELLGLTGDGIEDSARQHLTQLELAAKVQIKNREYSTIDLSSGQKKRIAMVTARLEARPVIILDEWASDQDPAFRDMFYRVLLPELKKQGKIVVVVSHDDRYFDAADRTVRLLDGKLVDITQARAS